MYQCKYCDKLIKLCPDCIIKPQQNQLMHYSFKSTPTATLKSRTQTITKSNQPSSIPGPGDYNVKKPLPKAGTIAQTNQKRQLFKTINYGPGPGSYEPPSYISSGQKRSMSARFFRPPPKIPGPAEYDTNHLNNRNKQPVYSIGNKSKSPQKIIEDHNTYKPSPGLYESKSTFNKSAGVIFGSSNRKDLTETERTPAPNYYTSQKDMQVSSLNPRCSIGTEKRQLKIKIVEATPGPAKYQKKTFFEQNKDLKKGFTCRPKIRDLIAEQISRFPAPGQYKSEILNFKQSAPRLATTQSKRITFIDQVQSAKKDIPAFSKELTNFFSSSRYRATSAFSLGSSKRRPLDENQRTPGPVAYSNDRLHVMNRQPAFSCPKTVPKNEFLKIVDPQNPGPGMYDSKIDLVKSNTSSVIVMKEKRPDFEHQRKKPGPGQYNLIKQHQPKFGWTKQKRISFTDQKSQAKHGTHYELDANFSKPPSYMRVESKIKYSPTKSGMASTGGF